MEVDETTTANIYSANLYIGGKLEGRAPNPQETARADFSAAWFAKFPLALNHDPNEFAPTAGAPFLQSGPLSADAPADRNGVPRAAQADLGPIEVP